MGALHRPDLGDRIGAGGIGEAKCGFGRSARQPETDEGTTETVTGAGRIDFIRREGGHVGAAGPIEVACSLVSALDHDVADAAVQKFLDRGGLVVRLGEEIDLLARRQEKVGLGKNLVQGLTQTRCIEDLGPQVGIEAQRSTPRRDARDGLARHLRKAGCGECGAHDMHVVAAFHESLGVRRRVSLPVALWAML